MAAQILDQNVVPDYKSPLSHLSRAALEELVDEKSTDIIKCEAEHAKAYALFAAIVRLTDKSDNEAAELARIGVDMFARLRSETAT